jgi:S1-C subfamily serine protease
MGAGWAAAQSSASSAQQQAQEMQERIAQAQKRLIDNMLNGTVRIEAEKDVREIGTGIVLSSNANSVMILTALHLVQGAHSIAVMFHGNPAKRYTARKLPAHSEMLDLAMIEVNAAPGAALPADLPKSNFVANNNLQDGEHVWSVNGDWTRVPNNLTKLSHDGDPQKFEYSNVSVGEGYSGGPVFDDYLNVIGMHDAMSGDKHYALGVKIDSALQVLQALDYARRRGRM